MSDIVNGLEQILYYKLGSHTDSLNDYVEFSKREYGFTGWDDPDDLSTIELDGGGRTVTVLTGHEEGSRSWTNTLNEDGALDDLALNGGEVIAISRVVGGVRTNYSIDLAVTINGNANGLITLNCSGDLKVAPLVV